jgi:hypothetical protein
MSLSNNFPTINPTLNLDFANVGRLDPRITFTRASTATYFNNLGVLTTAGSGVARFDYNPSTLQPRGLLIEEQRTNLLTYSDDLTQAAWNKTLGTVTVTVAGDVVTSPDGTVNADKVITANATGDHVIAQVTSVTSGTTYTQTWFLKAAELIWVQVTESTGFGSTQFQNINLSNGTTGNGNYGSAVTVTSVGNGWYRVSVTDTATATSASGRFLLALLTSDVAARLTDITGNGTDGVYVWGAQLEAGAFATSYIPTTTTALTRSADVASMTGTNFSSWYNAVEGTLFVEGSTAAAADTYIFADINSGITNNYIRQSTSSAGTNNQFVVQVTGSTVASPGVAVTLGSSRKMAGAYILDSIQQAVNGTLGTEDTSAAIPTGLSQMNLGSRANSTNDLQVWLARIAYYPTRLANAQLQALTG